MKCSTDCGVVRVTVTWVPIGSSTSSVARVFPLNSAQKQGPVAQKQGPAPSFEELRESVSSVLRRIASQDSEDHTQTHHHHHHHHHNNNNRNNSHTTAATTPLKRPTLASTSSSMPPTSNSSLLTFNPIAETPQQGIFTFTVSNTHGKPLEIIQPDLDRIRGKFLVPLKSGTQARSANLLKSISPTRGGSLTRGSCGASPSSCASGQRGVSPVIGCGETNNNSNNNDNSSSSTNNNDSNSSNNDDNSNKNATLIPHLQEEFTRLTHR